MRCSLPPHNPLTFAGYHEYEAHYNSAHTNRCGECSKNLPTAHFLELHITENHDPIVASRRDAGEKTFACLVEGCDKVCLDWKKRRSHLVDKHGFPRNYDFLVVNSGVDGKRSMLRPGVDAQGHRKSSRERRSSSVTEQSASTEATSLSEVGVIDKAGAMDAGEHDVDVPSENITTAQSKENANSVDELAASMSSLRMVPRSLTFGRRRGRPGLAKS
jgi:hypothetical protein